MIKKICLVTGATEGVGKATAAALARQGHTVILAARNEAKADAVRKSILAYTPDATVEYIHTDLASLRQVYRLAKTFRQRYGHLDVLINNAGIYTRQREVTEDGFEKTFQVNYLSHFFLTSLLRTELENSVDGRVINLSSSVYTTGIFDLNNLQSERKFSTIGTYANTKLLVMMSTKKMAAILNGRVTVNAVHPGIVRTNMMFDAPGILKAITVLAYPFSISPQKAAATSVHLATSDAVKGVSGAYFANMKMKMAKSKYDTAENREALWTYTMNALAAFSEGVIR